MNLCTDVRSDELGLSGFYVHATLWSALMVNGGKGRIHQSVHIYIYIYIYIFISQFTIWPSIFEFFFYWYLTFPTAHFDKYHHLGSICVRVCNLRVSVWKRCENRYLHQMSLTQGGSWWSQYIVLTESTHVCIYFKKLIKPYRTLIAIFGFLMDVIGIPPEKAKWCANWDRKDLMGSTS